MKLKANEEFKNAIEKWEELINNLTKETGCGVFLMVLPKEIGGEIEVESHIATNINDEVIIQALEEFTDVMKEGLREKSIEKLPENQPKKMPPDIIGHG